MWEAVQAQISASSKVLGYEDSLAKESWQKRVSGGNVKSAEGDRFLSTLSDIVKAFSPWLTWSLERLWQRRARNWLMSLEESFSCYVSKGQDSWDTSVNRKTSSQRGDNPEIEYGPRSTQGIGQAARSWIAAVLSAAPLPPSRQRGLGLEVFLWGE